MSTIMLRYCTLWRLLLRIICALLLTGLAAIVMIVAGHSSRVQAAGGQAVFNLQPVSYDPANPVTKSFFVFNSHAGTVIQSQVRVTNKGTAPGVVMLTPADATTGQTGGTVFLLDDGPRYAVGTWLKLGTSQLTLNPGQSQVVPFEVFVPRNAGPGQHVGGIAAESVTTSNLRSQSQSKTTSIDLNIRTIYVIAVQINLPGPAVESLSITGVQSGGYHSYQTVIIGLNNTGNMMLKPYGTLQVLNTHGQVLQNIALHVDTLLPATEINYAIDVQHKALGVGDYQAVINLTYGHGKQLHVVQAFSIAGTQISQVFGDQGGPLLYAGSQLTPTTMALIGAGLIVVLAGMLFSLFIIGRATVVNIGRKQRRLGAHRHTHL